MTSKRTAPRRDTAKSPTFTPVRTRARHDGWTPERQTGFIEALGESGCVDEACRRIGMSPSAAYALRRRVDAQGFRVAWDAALDYAVRRLSDAVFSRALNGVAVPVFYQGEQVGERRRYDERLAMFVLRYRDPVRYGAWLDRVSVRRHPDGAALALARSVDRVADDAYADAFGDRRPWADPVIFTRHMTPEQFEAEEAQRRHRYDQARADAASEAADAEDEDSNADVP